MIKPLFRSLRRRFNEFRGKEIKLDIDCSVRSRFLGSEYGGWMIATDVLPATPIVFSVGIGGDITFDLAVISAFHAVVYGFDPTPKSISYIESQSLPKAFHFVPIGLDGQDGTLTLHLPRADWDCYTREMNASDAVETVNCPVERFVTLANRCQVDSVDILKLDIEGSEYTSIPDILKTPIPVAQLLVELHYDESPAQLKRARDLVALIRGAGYRLFHRSPIGKELSFIHASKLR